MNKANLITKFSLNQKVIIKKGFYKGMKGNIKDVKKDKETTIYIIECEDKNTGKINNVEVEQSFLIKTLW